MKPNIIILEGCDKTGKSTLAEEISERGYEVIHLGVPKNKNDYFGQLYALIMECKKLNKKVVFDRFHWGDYVYQGITLPECLLTRSQHEAMENLLFGMGAIVIYCELPLDKIIEQFKKDNEELIGTNDIPVILERYEELISSTILPVYFHEFTSQPFLIL